MGKPAVDYFQWDVDPTDRMPIIPDDELEELRCTLMDDRNRFIWHNFGFDARALQSIIPDLDVEELAERSEDTLVASHVVNSRESHGLKDLGVQLGIPDEDANHLKKLVELGRKYAKRWGWKIGSKEAFPWMKRAPKSGWQVLDYWVPRQVYNILQEQGEDCPEDMESACRLYGCEDAVRTMEVWRYMKKQMKELGLTEQYQWRKELLPILYDMETRGVSLRKKVAVREHAQFVEMRDRFHRRAQKACGVNFKLGSHLKKKEIIYKQYKMEVKHYTKTGNPSVGKDTLQDMLESFEIGSKPFRFALNLYAAIKANKMQNDYLASYLKKAVKENGRWLLHCRTNMTGTKTVRMSASDPNPQQVAKGKAPFYWKIIGHLEKYSELGPQTWNLRRCFGPSKGREWVCIDGKQLQLVIFAYASGERKLQEKFELGYDAHDIIARAVFDLPDSVKPDDGQRTIGKNVNFGFIFGAGPKKIDATARKKGLYKKLKKMFPNATGFIRKMMKQAEADGWVETMGGYRLYVDPKRTYAAVNYIVQGTEAEIIQRAMILCTKYLKKHCPGAYITLNVHDELVFDFPAGQAAKHTGKLCRLMRKAAKMVGVKAEMDAKAIFKSWDKGASWNPETESFATVA